MLLFNLLLLFILKEMVKMDSLIVDESCYESNAKIILSNLEDEDFKEELSHYTSSPFTVIVRYCLGEEGDVDSNDFVQCVIEHSICGSPWYANINWEFCLCNTLHCMVKNCLQYWAETSDFANFNCYLPCLSQSHNCITRQTGKYKGEH